MNMIGSHNKTKNYLTIYCLNKNLIGCFEMRARKANKNATCHQGYGAKNIIFSPPCIYTNIDIYAFNQAFVPSN